LAQHRDRVGGRFPGVDDDGLVEGHGQRDLGCEDFALDVLWREVVVIIETDLADGDRLVSPDGPPGDGRRLWRASRVRGGSMRVNGRTKPDGRPAFRPLPRALQFVVFVGRQDAERALETRRLRSLGHGREVPDERLVGEMTVRVDDPHAYLTRVPGAGG